MAGHPFSPSPSIAHQDLTYPSPNLKDFTLDDNNIERALPLDNGRHSLNPNVDLGILERLPLEILDEVLVQIDLDSLTRLRCVNQRAMQIVDSIPQYRAILQHSPASIRGILAIGTGSLISSRELFHALTTATCENCHDFGGFIYLLTCTRVCFLCFSEDVRYLPLLATEVKRRFGIDNSVPANLSRMQSVSGTYSPNERLCRARLILYDYESARRAAEKYHGSAAAVNQYVTQVASECLEAYHNRISCWNQQKNGPIPRRPPRVVALDGKASNPRRFMAIVRAPWVDPSTMLIDWGFHCIGCQRQYRARPFHWRRKYSTQTFDAHIRECGHIEGGSHCHRTIITGKQ